MNLQAVSKIRAALLVTAEASTGGLRLTPAGLANLDAALAAYGLRAVPLPDPKK